MIMSTPKQKKIFARATPQESAMSRAKIAPAAARSDATGGCSFGPLRAACHPSAERAAAASTTAIAKRSTARAAVRGRSFDASPANPGPLACATLVFAPCTPARSVAVKMDRQCLGRDRARGAVLARTGREPRQNQQTTEIAGQLRPVLRFWGVASRDVRARAYARTPAHHAREKLRTTEPHLNIYIDHGVSGSVAVLARFWSEPVVQGTPQTRRKPSFSIKIGDGYSISPRSCLPILPIRGQEDGRGAKSFGAGNAAGAAIGAAGLVKVGQLGASIGAVDQGARASGKNGGFLRVCAGRLGRVGTAMLERGAQIGGNARFAERRQQLGRLTAGAALGADRLAMVAAEVAQAGGVAPPSPRGLILRPFAPAFFPISIETHFDDCPAASRQPRQVLRGRSGSGENAAPSEPCPDTGRGFLANWGLRRFGQRNGGGAHVN